MVQPDPGIKKVTLKQKDLAAMYTQGGESLNQYFVRYRIVNEASTQTSAWSQIYSVNGTSVGATAFGVEGYNIISDGTTITATWKLPQEVVSTPFDVYVRWHESNTKPTSSAGWTPWQYVSETTSSTVSMLNPKPESPSETAPYKWCQIYVQRVTFPKIVSEPAKLFETSYFTTRSTTNSGIVTNQ